MPPPQPHLHKSFLLPGVLPLCLRFRCKAPATRPVAYTVSANITITANATRHATRVRFPSQAMRQSCLVAYLCRVARVAAVGTIRAMPWFLGISANLP